MKNKGLFFILLLGGIVVYYGLLVVPRRLTLKNLVLFVIYVSAASFLLYCKAREEQKSDQNDRS
ncbi:MAG: hypothetical protein GXO27_03515 [Chlorobi bacterium]|nr:hypothetical protein [Chlorobiota bacterium]